MQKRENLQEQLIELKIKDNQEQNQLEKDLTKQEKINLSLSAFGNVITAFVNENTQHIPYRNSKLTSLSQDSLGDNSKIIMFTELSPADYCQDQTISCLKDASKTKMIENQPKINEDLKMLSLNNKQMKFLKLKSKIYKSNYKKQLQNVQCFILIQDLRSKENQLKKWFFLMSYTLSN
ncbi:unnamed protein product [Paramecium sonneborni]|uniref:Kinesin motor domain-containing protein n=1 Tax=Paramecium sonneborni TaxID=65129 RepID=A0A8S1Q067_9CILI|nr:unnamed protein product [Paramecium sonneborni]